MGVLNVVDRVLVRLLHGQIEVEIDRAVGRAGDHEVAYGVRADLINQLVKGNELAAAGAHLHLLAATHQVDDLVQQGIDEIGVVTQGAHAHEHLRRGGVVVGAKDIDDQIEAAPGLVAMVGNVGQAVGGFAAGLDHDAVFLVAEFGGAEPLRAVQFIDVAALLQLRQRLPDGPGLVEALLAEVVVEDDAHAGQGRLLLGGDVVAGVLREEVGWQVGQRVAVLGDQGAGQVDDVLALVMVGQQFGRLRQLL